MIDHHRQTQNLLYVPLYYQKNLSFVVLAASSVILAVSSVVLAVSFVVLIASLVSWQSPKNVSLIGPLF